MYSDNVNAQSHVIAFTVSVVTPVNWRYLFLNVHIFVLSSLQAITVCIQCTVYTGWPIKNVPNFGGEQGLN